MLFERPERRRHLLSAGNLISALVVHIALFAALWGVAVFNGFFSKKEPPVVPIELTVVVNENLNGKENEPPPTQKPPPPKPTPPKPKPKPQPPKVREPEKPKELEQIVTNIVTKVEKKPVEKKPKKEEVKKPNKDEPKEVVKKPEPPKKTAAQIRRERIEKIRGAGTVVNTPVKIEVPNTPSGNGRTDKKTLSDAEIKRLLSEGYKPGASTQLAANEEQLGLSLIKTTFESKWNEPPWTDTLKPMVIRVWFGPGGRILRYNLDQSSGDSRADHSIKDAASRVGAIPALPAKFIEKYRRGGVPIRFTVMPK